MSDTTATASPAASAPAAEFAWTRRHLLELEDLSAEEITFVLDTAAGFADVSTRSIKKVPALRGKVVVNAFFEESTRTRTSFSLAAARLSADVVEFTASSSSVKKGESLRDTVRNLEAMGIDVVVVRHSASGVPRMLSESLGAAVVNAGDGRHEHPTQGLLDIYTIREIKGRVAGLTVALVGDIANSRVARSNIWGLTKLGAKVILVGPSTLVPTAFRDLGCEISHSLDEVLPRVDVVNMLRVQFERLSSHVFPSVREYSRLFGLTAQRVARCRPDVTVMHPGPINRGLELSGEVADGPRSAILRQVSNGLAVRMAVLYLVNQATEAARSARE
jgi:aspartate carbamoyltransferase catalytic subunit